MSPRELLNALLVLESYSKDIEDYDVSFDWDDDLREVLSSPQDVVDYANLLLSRTRVDLEEDEPDWEQVVGMLGMAGSLQRMLGKIDDAEKTLRASCEWGKLHSVSDECLLPQEICYFQVCSAQGRQDEAYEGLQKLLEKSAKVPGMHALVETCLGEVLFRKGDFAQALAHFTRALELRKIEGHLAPIASTERMIAITDSKIRQLSLN